jgi:predicted esterase
LKRRIGVVLLRSLLLTVLLTSAARAEPEIEVDREDVGRTFLLYEQVHVDNPPTQDRSYHNRRFDWMTHLVFRGRFARATEELERSLAGMLPPELATPAARAARATLVRVEPRYALPGRSVTISLAPAFAVENRPEKLWIEIVRDGETVGVRAVPTSGTRFRWQPRREAATYEVRVHGEQGRAGWVRSTFSVLPQKPEALQAALQERLDALPPELAQSAAAATVRARLGLLAVPEAERRTAMLLVDQAELARDLPAEVDAVEAGRDPYVDRTGDFWRMLGRVPGRVYVSPRHLQRARQADRSLPLVVAMHGAGGDENLFMVGYGAGLIKRLADRHGFVVVTPRTYDVLADASNLGDIIETAAAAYPIDRDRVYLVGHSLGAITASLLTSGGTDPAPAGHELVAAAGLLAGGTRIAGANPLVSVPTFVVAAGHDRIFPEARLRASAEALQALGVPVEFRLYDDEAHVSVVARSLPDVIPWLLRHRRVAAE